MRRNDRLPFFSKLCPAFPISESGRMIHAGGMTGTANLPVDLFARLRQRRDGWPIAKRNRVDKDDREKRQEAETEKELVHDGNAR